MILYRSRGLQGLHCLLQALAAAGMFWAWVFVFDHILPNRQLLGSLALFFNYGLLVAAAVAMDHMRIARQKTDFLNLSFVQNCGISLRQTLTVLLLLLLSLVAFKHQTMSREFVFSFIPVFFLLALVSNRLFPLWLARSVFSGNYVQNTILLGSRRGVARLTEWLSTKVLYGVKLVGVVTEGPQSEPVDGLPHLGAIAQLDDHIRKVSATQVIAVDVPHSPVVVNHLANTCQRRGVRLLLANDYELMLGRRISMTEEDGVYFISFHREPLESPFSRLLKRTVDLLVALPVVVFLLPVLCVVVWLLQRWQSPGPLFFQQLRTGMQGQDFLLYKFRTMHPNNPDEARQARVHDERIFPAGRWLRKMSIDEIPQFLNVLKGEMSVVGPRPHLRKHDDLFRQKMISYGVRTFIKPGITGLAQVRDLRGEILTDEDVIQRVRSDLDYLENWSLLLDVEIIFRTIWKVVCPSKNAH
ncbi:MAG: exopolysaccharide biosynthesis polyprenyl glycosylphosphotransferase [Chthoniobacteraceae bacterium]|nr:exopolysaccharide biosynthesis polyprenyl glycosylphosphotransferase [Chthoniobacteraceae bacterium]